MTSEPLAYICVEGAVDRFCGRPITANPYCRESAPDYYDSWDLGHRDADGLLEDRGQEEATRWLREAA